MGQTAEVRLQPKKKITEFLSFVLISFVETLNCTRIDIGTVYDNLVYFNSICFSS